MADRYIKAQAPATGGGNVNPTYVRDSEYIAMPTLTEGEEKIVMLVKVYPSGNNYISFRVLGDFDVDFGDGTTGSYLSNTKVDHDFSYSGTPSGTTHSNGYRQATLIITPQTPGGLTQFKGIEVHPDDSGASYNGVFDVAMVGANITTIQMQSYYTSMERFNFVGPNSITSTSNLFYNAGRLQEVTNFDTSNVTNGSNMFFACSKLISIPDTMNFSQLTNATTLWSGCASLVVIPYDYPVLQNANSMFVGCFSLREIGQITSTSINNATQMFNGCEMLSVLPPFELSASTTLLLTFSNCTQLEDLSWVNIDSCTNLDRTFSNCLSLTTYPETLDCTNVTTLNQCFYLNRSMKKAPTLVNVDSSSGSLVFYNCTELEKVTFSGTTPIFRGVVGSIFSNCVNLVEIPTIDLSLATTFGTIAGSCYQLRGCGFTGVTKTHSYDRAQFSRDAIVTIFNNLPTVVGQTITLSNIPGTADLTAGDLAIATGKGWTVVT